MGFPQDGAFKGSQQDPIIGSKPWFNKVPHGSGTREFQIVSFSCSNYKVCKANFG